MAPAGERAAAGAVTVAEPRLTPAAGAARHRRPGGGGGERGRGGGAWSWRYGRPAGGVERARFGELFVKRGLCCDVAGLGRLASLVGRERAAELLFTGRIVDADEAAASAS